jgi:hypothetical protein
MIVFSMHNPVSIDVLEISNRHFKKEYEKTFISPAHFGHTYLAAYRLDFAGVGDDKGSDISGARNP